MDLWAEAELVASERGLVGREAEAFAERWVSDQLDRCSSLAAKLQVETLGLEVGRL
jgi:hypothetical protein